MRAPRSEHDHLDVIRSCLLLGRRRGVERLRRGNGDGTEFDGELARVKPSACPRPEARRELEQAILTPRGHQPNEASQVFLG